MPASKNDDTAAVLIDADRAGFIDHITDAFEEVWERIGREADTDNRDLVPWQPWPAADAAEFPEEMVFWIELPGVGPEDVEVRVSADVLLVCGRTAAPKGHLTPNYVFQERHFGRFQRTFPLPRGTDLEHIAASFENGLLTVTVPRRASARIAERKVVILQHG